jgi:hypothetical protein
MERRSRALPWAGLVVGAGLLALLWWVLPRGGAQPETGAASATDAPRAEGSGAGSERARASTPGARAERPVPVSRPTDVLVSTSWGSGAGQLARSTPEEGNPEGPMSFSIGPEGTLLVLDQVNGRIARYDRNGEPLAPIPVSQTLPHELAVAPDGSLVVMDRLADRSVAIFDPQGKLVGDLPLTGKNLPEPGLATGLFVDETGIYVERGHGPLVRVGDLGGRSDPAQPLLDGRPTPEGKSLLSAAMIDAGAGRFWVRSVDRASGQMRFMKELRLPVPLRYLMYLDADRAGRIYVGAAVGREPAPGEPLLDEGVQVLCLSPEGEVRGSAMLPPNQLPDETFRELTVTEDGTILYLHRTEAGAELRRYRCS